MRPKTSQIILTDRRFVMLAALLWIATLVAASLIMPRSTEAQISMSDPLQGEQATITKGDSSQIDTVTIGPIADTNCSLRAASTATVVLNADGEEITISTAQNTFEVSSDGLTITITGKTNDGVVATASRLANGNYDVESSRGITCGKSNEGNASDDENQANNDADDLLSLSCEELLKRFRAGDDASGQYGDNATFADEDVRERVEECLKKEIIEGTAADEKLPDTGGLSLLSLAILCVVSVVAGVSVVRGARRDR